MNDSTQLLDLLVCPTCQCRYAIETDGWLCPQCGTRVELWNGKPAFTAPLEQTATFERVERGPEKGTPWRKANWRFLDTEAKGIPLEARILDIGAGHGDFAQQL